MIKYKRTLSTLSRCSPGMARRIIRQGDDDLILAILDAVWTTLAGKVDLLPEQLSKIRSVQPVLRRFADRGQSVDERRRVLLRKRNGVRAVQTVLKVIRKKI